MNPKSIALQSGVEVENTPQTIHMREVADVEAGSVTISQFQIQMFAYTEQKIF